MKTILILFCFLIPVPVFSSITPSKDKMDGEIAFYVATEGNNSQSGKSIEEPFATLEKARDAIRELKRDGGLKSPVNVYILGGTYELTEPLILTTEDSGTKECPVTYRAYKDEKPVISGGREIKAQWKPYKGNIMVCTVPEAKDGKWKFRQLFFNGNRMVRARTPDKDKYFRVVIAEEDIGQNALKYRDGDVRKWENLDQAEVIIFHAWNDSRLFISDIDEQERIITFTGSVGRRFKTRNNTNKYFIENILEGLDQPGEWYLDSHSGQLYLYPTEDLGRSELRAPVISQLVILQGDLEGKKYVQYVNFSGLTFSDAGYSLPEEGISQIRDVGDIYKPSAITFNAAKFCTFEDNCIRNTGTYALEVTGDANTITWNKIYDTGGGGIITRSYGKEPNKITYNHIHDCGKVWFSAVGINVDDGGGEIAHNLVHDIPQSGIYGRHWATETQEQERRNQEQTCLIEYNEIHSVMQKLNDGAGIFIRDSNNIIRNNLIYDVFSYPGTGAPGFGIYLGCETRYTLVENNIIDRSTEGIHVWLANRHNTIVNNIIIDSKGAAIRCNNQEGREHENIVITKNIIQYSDPYGAIYRFDSKPGSKPTVSDSNIYWNPFECLLQMPSVIINYHGVGTHNYTEWTELGYEKNSLVMNPEFSELSKGEYSLKPNSPALIIGFNPIDISNVGLRSKSR